jgi:DNA repair exonuclease SbcCD nuclease subunit
MKKLHILVVGDLHWGSISNLFPNDWLNHTESMLNQVVDYAYKSGVKYIFFTGDIFNVSQPSQNIMLLFYKYFSNHKNLKFIYFAGNHDIMDAKTNSLLLFSGISDFSLPHCKFIIKPTVVRIKGHDIVVNPWPHTKLPKGSDNAKLGFAHVIAENTIADNGRKFGAGERLSKKVFWIIGDLHTNQRTKYWYYPGAPLQFNFQDDKQRFFADVTLGRKIRIKDVPLQSTYKLMTKVLKRPSDFEFLESPNTYWRIYADQDLDVPKRANIILRLPRTKQAKQLTKDVNKGLDKVTVVGEIPKADDWLKSQGFDKDDRRRLLGKLKELR